MSINVVDFFICDIPEAYDFHQLSNSVLFTRYMMLLSPRFSPDQLFKNLVIQLIRCLFNCKMFHISLHSSLHSTSKFLLLTKGELNEAYLVPWTNVL